MVGCQPAAGRPVRPCPSVLLPAVQADHRRKPFDQYPQQRGAARNNSVALLSPMLIYLLLSLLLNRNLFSYTLPPYFKAPSPPSSFLTTTFFYSHSITPHHKASIDTFSVLFLNQPPPSSPFSPSSSSS